MRNLLSTGAVLAASALALTGCQGGGSTPTTTTTSTQTVSGGTVTAKPSTSASSSAAAPAGSGTLVVWVDSNREAAAKNIVDDFKKQTGVTVQLVVKDFDKIKDDAISQIPTGNGPDVFIGPHDNTGTYVKNGIVAPIELGTKKAEFRDVAVKGFTYDGKVYGVPLSTENLALVRNTALAPTAPTSFDDMIKTGKDLVAQGKATSPFLLQQGKDGDPYHLYPLQASFGAPVFNLKSDGSYDPSKLAMDNDGGVKYATALSTWGKDKTLSLDLTGDIAKEQFAAGKAPYMITGPWNLDTFKKGGIKYAIDPIPSAGGSPATPFVGVQGFFVSAKTKQQLAANKFVLDFMGSESVQTALFKTGNRAPANTKAYEAAKSDADVAAFGKVGDAGVPMPNVPAMDAVWKFWGATEASLIKGEATDPAATWKKMCADITAEMAK